MTIPAPLRLQPDSNEKEGNLSGRNKKSANYFPFYILLFSVTNIRNAGANATDWEKKEEGDFLFSTDIGIYSEGFHFVYVL